MWTAHYDSALWEVHWTLLTLEELQALAAGLEGATLADISAVMVGRCRLMVSKPVLKARLVSTNSA